MKYINRIMAYNFSVSKKARHCCTRTTETDVYN